LLLPAYRQKRLCSGLFNAGPTNRIPRFKIASVTGLGYVPDSLRQQH
jgi:hypothetical protein